MKFIHYVTFIFAVTLFSNYVKAQDSLGTLYLYVYNDSVKVLIDDTLKTPSISVLKLKQGTHSLSVKGKDLKPVYKTIQIKADSNQYLRIIMKKSDEYITYKRQMFFYNTKKNSLKFGGALIPIGLASLSYISYSNSKKTANEYEDIYNRYLTSSDINEITKYKQDAEDLKSKYNRQYNSIYIYAGSALITTYLYYKYIGKLINKIDKPVYRENLSSNISLDPNYRVHFTINYKF